jgi:hypothetical protein
LVSRHLTRVIPTDQAAVREQLIMSLEPAVVEEFRWYVHARQTGLGLAQERFDQAVRAFGAPRFQAVYGPARARRDGGRRLIVAHTQGHFEWGAGPWEYQVLPHASVQLLLLVGTA